MHNDYDHFATPRIDDADSDSLAADDLRRVDARLRDAAVRSMARHTPIDLADRVFEASVGELQRPASAGGRGLRLVGTADERVLNRALIWRRTTWSRIALAASVALAFVLAGRFVSTSSKRAEYVIAPPHTHNGSPAISAVAYSALAWAETDWLPSGASDIIDADLAYLLETRELTSFDDLAGELAMLGDASM